MWISRFVCGDRFARTQYIYTSYSPKVTLNKEQNVSLFTNVSSTLKRPSTTCYTSPLKVQCSTPQKSWTISYPRSDPNDVYSYPNHQVLSKGTHLRHVVSSDGYHELDTMSLCHLYYREIVQNIYSDTPKDHWVTTLWQYSLCHLLVSDMLGHFEPNKQNQTFINANPSDQLMVILRALKSQAAGRLCQ